MDAITFYTGMAGSVYPSIGGLCPAAGRIPTLTPH